MAGVAGRTFLSHRPDDVASLDASPPPAPSATEAAARLEQAMDLAGLGLITVDYAADTAVADAKAAALFGLPADVPVTRRRLHAHIHPDDRAAVEARIAAAIAGDGASRPSTAFSVRTAPSPSSRSESVSCSRAAGPRACRAAPRTRS